jgi:hypothetical protein
MFHNTFFWFCLNVLGGIPYYSFNNHNHKNKTHSKRASIPLPSIWERSPSRSPVIIMPKKKEEPKDVYVLGLMLQDDVTCFFFFFF